MKTRTSQLVAVSGTRENNQPSLEDLSAVKRTYLMNLIIDDEG
jgi:hypothetical protein